MYKRWKHWKICYFQFHVNGNRITVRTADGDRLTVRTAGGDRLTVRTSDGDRLTVSFAGGDRLTARTADGDRLTVRTADGDRLTVRTADGDGFVEFDALADAGSVDGPDAEHVLRAAQQARHLVAVHRGRHLAQHSKERGFQSSNKTMLNQFMTW